MATTYREGQVIQHEGAAPSADPAPVVETIQEPASEDSANVLPDPPRTKAPRPVTLVQPVKATVAKAPPRIPTTRKRTVRKRAR